MIHIKVPVTPQEFVGKEPTICDLEYFVLNLPSFILTEMNNMKYKIQNSDMSHDDRAVMCSELMYYQELVENLKNTDYNYGIRVYKRQIEKMASENNPVFYLCGIIPTGIDEPLSQDFLEEAVNKNIVRINTTGEPVHITAQMFEDENYKCTTSLMNSIELFYKHRVHSHYRPPDGQGYLLTMQLFKDRYIQRLRP